jgi:hypothetical protein
MKVSEHHFDRLDPVINVFRTFGRLNDVVVTAKMSIIPESSFVDSVHSQAHTSKADMVIVPWTSDLVPLSGATSTIPQDEFIKQVLDKVECHVSVMIDTNLHRDDESPFEPSLNRSISMSSLRHRATSRAASTSEIETSPVVQVQEGYHVFLPYWGGRDDRVALRMVLQLLQCPEVKATIIRIRYSGETNISPVASPVEAHTTPPKEIVPESNIIDTSHGLAAFVAKKVHFPRGKETTSTPVSTEIDHDDDSQFTMLVNSVPLDIKPRLTIENITTDTPLQYAIKRIKKDIHSHSTNYHLVVVGRASKFARPGSLSPVFRRDLRDLVKEGQSNDVVGISCLGDVGEAMLLGKVMGGLIVVQSGKDEED